MRIDASGMEAQLEELNERWFAYQQQLHLDLSKKFSTMPEVVYEVFDYSDGDPHCSYIFSNTESIKRIRWQHFLTDCQPIMADIEELKGELNKTIQAAEAWLQSNYEDIMTNFDPSVVKFKKRNKIILSADALEDLQRLEDDHED